MQIYLLIKFLRKASRRYLKHGSKDFVFSGINGRKIHVLGNGPSLSGSLHLIEEEEDVVMVNYSVLTDLFFKLKPLYFCLADPAYFKITDDVEEEIKKARVVERLKKVDWDLIIITPAGVKTSHFRKLNSRITFESVNTVPLDTSVKFMRWSFYKWNFSMPSLQNVIVLGVFISLQKGYSNVYLHGVDSDSYKNICVNQQNEMVTKEFHSYGSSSRNLNSQKWCGFPKGSLYKRLKCEVIMFRSYVDLAAYANHLCIRVINASPNSMIDAFERYDHGESLNK